MHRLLDLQKEYDRFSRKKKLSLILFAAVSLIVIAGSVLGIVYSPANYVWLQWVLIVILAVYSWFCLYFFTVSYRDIRFHERFYAAALKGQSSQETLCVLSFDTEHPTSKDGLDAYLLKTSFKEAGKTYERDLYVFDKDLSFKTGSAIQATTFASVLLAYEEVGA
jgi:hypothetical protein